MKKKEKQRLKSIAAAAVIVSILITVSSMIPIRAETRKLSDTRRTGYSYYVLMNYYRTDYSRPSRGSHGLIDHYEWGGETVFCVNPWMPAADTTNQYHDSGDFYDWSGISYIEVPRDDGTRFPLVYTPEVINEITLISYFGYDYPGHQTEEYYAAAQKLIWEAIIRKPVTVYVGNKACKDVGCEGAPEADLSREIAAIRALMDEFKLMRIGWSMEYVSSARYPAGTPLSDPKDIRKGEIIRVRINSGNLARYRFEKIKGLTLCEEDGTPYGKAKTDSLSAETGMASLNNTFCLRIDEEDASFTLTTALMQNGPADVPFLLTTGNAADQEMIRRGRVRNADTKTQTFSAKTADIRLHIEKKTADGRMLKGAALAVLEKESGKEILSWTSSDTPYEKNVTGILKPGTVCILRETKTPEGYVQASDREFTVPADPADGETVKVQMTDTRVSVRKTDEEGKPLAGAKLQIIEKASRKVIQEIVSTDHTVYVSGLQEGKTYILHEAEAPEGFTLAEDEEFTPDGTKDIALKAVDRKKRISLRLEKTDAEGNILSGAVFTLHEKGNNAELARMSVQKGVAEINDASFLQAGHTYVLQEIQTPEGYVTAADAIFTVPETYSDGHTVKIRIRDPRVSVLKTDEKGNPLAGAKLQIIEKETGKIIQEIVSTDHAIPVSGLKEGKAYLLHEAEAPEGYTPAEDREFTPAADENTVLKAVNRRNRISLSLEKTDAEGNALSGAVFTLCEKGDSTVLASLSVQKGTGEIKDASFLQAGHTYVLKETQTPEGYVTGADAVFTVPARFKDGYTVKIRIKDPRVSVLKTDEEGKPLAGAKLEVADESGNTADTWTTSKEPHYVSGLKAGMNYILRETEAPAGRVRFSDISFRADPEQDVRLTAADARAKIILRIRKVTAEGKHLAGAKLAVFDSEDSAHALYEWISEEQEYVSGDAAKLKPGRTYILREKEAPEGFVRARDVTFTIPETYEDGYTVSIEMKDPQVTLTKTDETGSPVKGAQMTVIDRKDGSVADTWITDGKEHAVRNLTEGNAYILRETVPPFGYAPVSDMEFTPDQKDLKLQAADRRLPVYVSVIKHDAYDTSVKLAGAQFTVYEKDTEKTASDMEGKPAVMVTDTEGKASLVLPYRKGGYFMKETKAPEGYLMPDEPQIFEIVPSETYSFKADDGTFAFEAADEADTSVSLRKLDAETEERPQGDAVFAGAQFCLTDTATGKEAGRFVIREDGTCPDVIRHLPFADGRIYRLTETKAPAGYHLLGEPVDLKLTAEERHITLQAHDHVKSGRISVHKVFDGSEKSSLVQEEQGASFAVILKSYAGKFDSFEEALASLKKDPSSLTEKEWDEGMTDEKGIWKSRDLAYGTYILKQTGTPDASSSPVTEPCVVNVSGEDSEEILLHFSDKPLKYRLRIVKKDAETGKNITLFPASFRIADENGKAVTFRPGQSELDTFMTYAQNMPSPYGRGIFADEGAEAGTVTLPGYLAAGHTYTITEIISPKGYVIPAEPYVLKLSGSEIGTLDENGDMVITAEIRNRKAYGRLEVIKTLEEDPHADRTLIRRDDLSGIVFTLTAAEDITDPCDGSLIVKKGGVYGTYKTGKDGRITVGKIPCGKYILAEKEVPAGILMMKQPEEIIFEADSQTVSEYTVQKEIENRTVKTLISKQTVTGTEELPGAELTLSDARTGEIIDSWISGEKPHMIEGLMPDGRYILTEIAVPETEDGKAFAKAESIEFAVNSDGSVQTVVMKNRTVSVSKQDVSGKELAGAHMTVRDEAGNTVDEWISADTPHAIRNLEEGKSYVIHEDTAPLGYVTATDIPFTLSGEMKDLRIDVKNAAVSVSKQDFAGSEVEGALMCVTDESGNVIDEWVSEKQPHMIKGLSEGKKYILSETAAPKGYYRTESIPFTVKGNRADTHFIMKDAPVRYRIMKCDETSEPVPGVILKLFDITSGEEKEISPEEGWVTGKDPIILDGILEAGHRYSLREEEYVPGVYSADSLEFEVGEYAETDEPVTIVMEDSRTSVSVLKTDASGRALAGADLSLYDAEGNLIYSWISSEEAEDISSLVKGGMPYTVKETSAPFGYQLSEDCVFTVSGRAESHQLISILDRRQTFRLKIFKTDEDDRTKPLAGAEFTLYDRMTKEAVRCADGRVASAVTDDSGYAVFDLPYSEGGYYVMETKAPEGYTASPEKYEVTIPADYQFREGDPILITVADSSIPETGDAGKGRWIAMLVLSLSAAALVLLGKKRLC